MTLEVLAAGQWRCATSSLQIAFEECLFPSYTPSMHGARVLPSVRLLKLACAACREQDRERRHTILHQIFDGYNASSDFPGFAFVDDLLDMYPDCLLILNKRNSPEAWQESVRSSLQFFSSRWYLLATWWVPQSYWHYQLYRSYMELAKRRHGIDDIFSTELYNQHNQWVHTSAMVRGRDVLEWEPSIGWEPLCKFIGREVPDEPFPRVNDAAAIEELKRYLVIRGLLVWAIALGLIAVAIATLSWAIQ